MLELRHGFLDAVLQRLDAVVDLLDLSQDLLTRIRRRAILLEPLQVSLICLLSNLAILEAQT